MPGYIDEVFKGLGCFSPHTLDVEAAICIDESCPGGYLVGEADVFSYGSFVFVCHCLGCVIFPQNVTESQNVNRVSS